MFPDYDIYQEINVEFKKKAGKKSNDKLVIMLILLLVLVIPFFVLAFMKSYEFIDDFESIGDPIQIPTEGGTIIAVNGDTVNVDFLAEYDIKGRVLATAQYGDNIFQKILGGAYREDNIIRYKDVGIGWGFLTQDDYVKRFDWTSLSRFLLPEYKSYQDYLYIKDRFSWDDINTHMSHNHLIPANNRIKKLLRGINKGQFIHIKGYLVRLYSSNGYQLVSSLTRDDQGDGACETIYVTDITWLKEK